MGLNYYLYEDIFTNFRVYKPGELSVIIYNMLFYQTSELIDRSFNPLKEQINLVNIDLDGDG